MGVYISLPRYTILLITRGRTIAEAPPIARWTIGKDSREVLDYFERQSKPIIEFIP